VEVKKGVFVMVVVVTSDSVCLSGFKSLVIPHSRLFSPFGANLL
jgi:hypothetical protein